MKQKMNEITLVYKWLGFFKMLEATTLFVEDTHLSTFTTFVTNPRCAFQLQLQP